MAFKPVRVNTTEREEDEDLEGDKDCNVDIVKQKNKNSKKCIYLIAFGLVLLALIVTAIVLTVIFTQKNEIQNNSNGDDPNKFRSDEEVAADILHGLRANNSNGNIDLDSFNQAFNVFDDDNDGYLNQTEFGNYFEIELQHSVTFKKIDIDNDNILSYREVVSYVSALSKIDIIFNTLFKENTIPTMISRYGYQYDNNNTSNINDTLFNEYAAIIMYFDRYDLDYNGYIRFDEYLSIIINDDFKFADVNSDNKISKNELINLLYGDKFDEYHHSFSGLLHEMFDNNVNNEQLFVKSLFNISITTQQVTNINLNLCPQQLQSNIINPRRLQISDCCMTAAWEVCEWVLPSGCAEVDPRYDCIPEEECRDVTLCCTKCHCAHICGKSC